MVSGNNWNDQHIKENDGSFVSIKGISKFQKFGIRVWEGLRWCKWGLAHWQRHEQGFERLEMTKFLRVIQQTQEKDFENECQEGITAQKLITQFWGCYMLGPHTCSGCLRGLATCVIIGELAYLGSHGRPSLWPATRERLYDQGGLFLVHFMINLGEMPLWPTD